MHLIILLLILHSCFSLLSSSPRLVYLYSIDCCARSKYNSRNVILRLVELVDWLAIASFLAIGNVLYSDCCDVVHSSEEVAPILLIRYTFLREKVLFAGLLTLDRLYFLVNPYCQCRAYQKHEQLIFLRPSLLSSRLLSDNTLSPCLLIRN